jgi:hypothetical protein
LPVLPLPGSAPSTPGKRPVLGVDPCRGLELEACNRTGFCVTAPAYGLDPVQGCATGDLVPLCNSLQGVLNSGLNGSVVAVDGAGRTLLVPWANLPADWEPLDPQPVYATAFFIPPACPSAATEAACAQHADAPSCRGERRWSCLAKVASHYDAAAGCVRNGEPPEVFLGCSGERPKLGARYFRDAQGEVWEVLSSAVGDVPAGWTAIDPWSVRPGSGSLAPCLIDL